MNMMKKISGLSLCALTFSLLALCSACSNGEKDKGNETGTLHMNSQEENHIKLVRNDEEKRVDVLINGEHFTSYLYPETLEKPVLYPLKTAQGTLVTRGFPLEARAGERVDHPHHVGLWFNYGDVNGLDFWNNSYAIPADKKDHYGTIIHKEINRLSSGDEKGELEVSMEWVGPDGEALLREETTFVFREEDQKRMIDRITTLRALDKKVSMHDNKEGLFGMRVARELEQPSDQPEIYIGADGKAAEEPVLNNEGVSGWYRSSEGIEGDSAWGSRAKWMNLSGNIGDEMISLAIMDHPDNVGHPAYWHARGYGLYAANSLGQKAMSGGKEELNFELPAGESVTFKHRIIIYSGEKVTDDQLNADFNEFSGK